MIEPKTFFDESFLDSAVSYYVQEDGLTYRPDCDQEFFIRWGDIQYIEDRPGDRVDIFLHDRKEVPVSYTTNEFPALLRAICLKLSEIRKETNFPQKFTLTVKDAIHLIFVVSVFALSLIISYFAGKFLFILLLVLIVPAGIFIQRQPISLTLGNHHVTVQDLLIKRNINYSEIQNLSFEVKCNDYGRTLCVLIQLKNREIIVTKKIENIILFFLLLQTKLDENIENNICELN